LATATSVPTGALVLILFFMAIVKRAERDEVSPNPSLIPAELSHEPMFNS
jgi:hypothetical protein